VRTHVTGYRTPAIGMSSAAHALSIEFREQARQRRTLASECIELQLRIDEEKCSTYVVRRNIRHHHHHCDNPHRPLTSLLLEGFVMDAVQIMYHEKLAALARDLEAEQRISDELQVF
jgi:hypothetical protein